MMKNTKLCKLISIASCCVLPALFGCAGLQSGNEVPSSDPFSAPIESLIATLAEEADATPPLPMVEFRDDVDVQDRGLRIAVLEEIHPAPPTLPAPAQVVNPFFEPIEKDQPTDLGLASEAVADQSLEPGPDPLVSHVEKQSTEQPVVSLVQEPVGHSVLKPADQVVGQHAGPTVGQIVDPPSEQPNDEPIALAEQPVVTAVPIEAAPGYVPAEIADPVANDASGYVADNVYPIDLANALGLGGANHLQIKMARERVVQAHSRLIQARVLTLPSLRVGYGWNKHDGRLQQTDGQVVEESRGSHFVGGGAGLGQVPLAGGANGPARFMVNLSMADAFFERLVEQNLHYSASKESSAVFNDALLQVSERYMNMLEAHGRYANAQTGVETLEQMVDATAAFEESGEATQTEVNRARTQLSLQKRRLENLDRQTKTSSAALVRLLRLDPNLVVVPADEQVVQLELIDASMQIPELLAMGIANRPETCQQQGLVWAAGQRVRQETWRPWLPNVQIGTSAGHFGGGEGSDFTNRGNRSDIDVLAIWEVQNLGFGNKALRQQTNSELREACLRKNWVHDQIEAEIVAAANDVMSYREQIQISQEAAERARDTYEMNLLKIREGEGLPLELIQAINSLVESLDAYVASVCDYNRAQFRLLRAIGQVPSA